MWILNHIVKSKHWEECSVLNYPWPEAENTQVKLRGNYLYGQIYLISVISDLIELKWASQCRGKLITDSLRPDWNGDDSVTNDREELHDIPWYHT